MNIQIGGRSMGSILRGRSATRIIDSYESSPSPSRSLGTRICVDTCERMWRTSLTVSSGSGLNIFAHISGAARCESIGQSTWSGNVVRVSSESLALCSFFNFENMSNFVSFAVGRR